MRDLSALPFDKVVLFKVDGLGAKVRDEFLNRSAL